MKTIAFHNLGCKVNAYETDVMMQNLQKKGWQVVPFDQSADVYVVNTCTVTNIADRKSRQMLHRAKKINPDAVVVAVGCYVETDPEGVRRIPRLIWPSEQTARARSRRSSRHICGNGWRRMALPHRMLPLRLTVT